MSGSVSSQRINPGQFALFMLNRQVSSAKVSSNVLMVPMLSEVDNGTFNDGPPLAPETRQVLLVEVLLKNWLSNIKCIIHGGGQLFDVSRLFSLIGSVGPFVGIEIGRAHV